MHASSKSDSSRRQVPEKNDLAPEGFEHDYHLLMLAVADRLSRAIDHQPKPLSGTEWLAATARMQAVVSDCSEALEQLRQLLIEHLGSSSAQRSGQ